MEYWLIVVTTGSGTWSNRPLLEGHTAFHLTQKFLKKSKNTYSTRWRQDLKNSLWDELQNLRPEKLKLSPIAVVKQRNRRGRIILEFSFPVYPERVKKGAEPIQGSVNETRERLEPDTSVKEIGSIFCFLLHFTNSVGTEEIVVFANIYLYHGFWIMMVEKDSKWNFAYMMPNPLCSPIWLVVPSVQQIRWA